MQLYIVTAIALAAALTGATGAWQVQGWRYTGQINEMKAAQQQAVADATREARAQESARFKGVQDAQAAAQTRCRKLLSKFVA
jgi:hypothetical protein